MFSKILIANRGEIACRVIETAHRLGVACVAIYSDVDRSARHVELADQAIHIGGSAPADSYLKGDTIIQAALATGTQAIHPGYGFLSENPGFVEAVEAAGLVFIGPSGDAIRAMGMKDAAKRQMEQAGVPVVPGYHGTKQGPKHLQSQADRIGYPVLIKAIAGGGGKGMRVVEAAADFPDALASARAEAKGAFGNDAVLIEKYIEKPRHIEMQVFGDGKDAVHMYERDCSLQRRHQKVIEEAPAPGMTPDLRAAMGDAAVRAAKAINYKGAGTVEFIVDASDGLLPDRFWFMEMNTRLQVEHPVTEAITGLDIVEWQLRVAAGETLPATQDEIMLNGHAIEARLYAEDVSKGFLPATGTLDHLCFPPNVRADTGVRAGDAISPFYDPMIAKIISHGPTREIALSQLSKALSETEVAGTITNLTFLGNLVLNSEFSKGQVDTGLIARHEGSLAKVQPPSDLGRASAVVAASGIDAVQDYARGFALWAPMRQTIQLCENSEVMTARITFDGPDQVVVSLNEAKYIFRRMGYHWVRPDGGRIRAKRIADKVLVFGRHTHEFQVIDPLSVAAGMGGGGNFIEAPMPGLVKAVLAKVGQVVNAGDRLAILEAMKMEHTLTAARDGVVAEVMAQAGVQVEAGAPLIRLEEQE